MPRKISKPLSLTAVLSQGRESTWLVDDSEDGERDSFADGISLKYEASKADLFKQSLQMWR